jgi:toxin ParE1/3/4
MQHRELALLAKADLLEIWNYTVDTWGEEQANRYLRRLDACFVHIVAGKFSGKRPLAMYPKLRAVRCEHHYVFFLVGKMGKKPTILAIFHEKMNYIARLKHRLAD